MAKVSPLLGYQRHDWKLRLTTLVNELGNWYLYSQSEEGTKRVSMSVHRRGTKLTVTTRLVGKHKNVLTYLSITWGSKHIQISVKNDQLSNSSVHINNVKTYDRSIDSNASVDYKALYKAVERNIYAIYSAAPVIMSTADAHYQILMDKDDD